MSDLTIEHVLVPTLSAERAWAHSMELKARESQDSDGGVLGTGQRRSRQRLSKAASHAATLRGICASSDGDTLARESSAYADWLKGLDSEMRGNHRFASEMLEQSRVAYTALADVQDQIVHPNVFRQRATDCMLALRRCSFASDGTCSSNASNCHEFDGDTRATWNAKNSLSALGSPVIKWCGTSLEVPAEQVQRQLVICEIEGEADVSIVSNAQSGGSVGLCCQFPEQMLALTGLLNESQYARKLQQLEELTRIAQAESDIRHTQEAHSGVDRITKHAQSFQLVAARASYEKLNLLFQRCDAALAELSSGWRYSTLKTVRFSIVVPASKFKPRAPDDVVYLYENLLQVTIEMVSLEGVRGAKDDTLAEALDARAATLQAYRCHFLAETLGASAKASMAFALFYRASYLSDRALQEAEACEALEMSREMTRLSDASRASMARLKATRALNSQLCDGAHFNDRYLSSCTVHRCLKIYAAHATLPSADVSGLPGSKSISCKPVLFNLAHNHLTFPPFQSELKDETVRGLFSWFRR